MRPANKTSALQRKHANGCNVPELNVPGYQGTNAGEPDLKISVVGLAARQQDENGPSLVRLPLG